MSRLRGIIDKIIDDKIAAATPAPTAASTTGPTVRDVENVKSQVDALVFQMNDAVGRLGTRVTSVETVNTTQNTKIAALEAPPTWFNLALTGITSNVSNAPQAAVIGNLVVIRGYVSISPTLTTVNAFQTVATLPADMPKPVRTYHFPTYANQTTANAAHYVGALRVTSAGTVDLGTMSTATVVSGVQHFAINCTYPIN